MYTTGQVALLITAEGEAFFLVPSGTKIMAILGIQWSSQRSKDQQLYVIYKYVTSSNVIC